MDYGFVDGRQVSLMRDSGSTILGIRRSLLKESQISNKKIKCITFGGSVESFNLTSIYLESPYICGRFDAVALPSPIVDVVLGNLPEIREPTKQQIQEWNIKHNLPIEEIQ